MKLINTLIVLLLNLEIVFGEGKFIRISLFACWVIMRAYLTSADFFQNYFFRKVLSEIPSECQIVWIQIRPDILSGLIWIQSVCICYWHTTQVGFILKTSKNNECHY